MPVRRATCCQISGVKTPSMSRQTNFMGGLQVEFAGRLGARARQRDDGPEVTLVAGEVLLQGGDQRLGMLRRHDDAAVHLALGRARQEPREVDYELRGGMADQDEVGIDALGGGFRQLDVDRLLVLILEFGVGGYHVPKYNISGTPGFQG